MVSVRKDALPESFRYEDDGCNLSPSCLNCPLPLCKYDHNLSALAEAERCARIFELRKQGVSRPEVARAFRTSTRTVDRIVERGGKPMGRIAALVEDDRPGKPVSEIGSGIKARQPLPRLQVAR